jgi:hypothetical protein
VSRHNECLLVAIPVLVYLTQNFTDAKESELEPTEYQQPSSSNIGASYKLYARSTNIKLGEEGECRYEFSSLVADFVVS